LRPNKPSAETLGPAIVYQGSHLFWKVSGKKFSHVSDRDLFGLGDISGCESSKQSTVSINQLANKAILWRLVSFCLITARASQD
jgi:hypothetical protein